MDAFEIHFGYREQKRNICITWDHLPFMQIFQNEKMNVKKTTVEVLHSLLNMGVSIQQANEYLETEFEIEEKPDEQGQQEEGTDPAAGEGTEGGEDGAGEESS